MTPGAELVAQRADTVNLMTRSSLVPVEEIQMWQEEQRADGALNRIIQRIQQKKETNGPRLTPQGLLYEDKNGHKCLYVLTSLRQVVLKCCHDDPIAGHVAIRRMQELLKRAY